MENNATNKFWGVSPHQRPGRLTTEVQRLRLMLGITRVISRKSYADATVADILEDVRVSRRTFYENFKDKDDCFLAAYESAHRALVQSIRRSQKGERDPLKRIILAHQAYLNFFAEEAEVGIAIMKGLYSGSPRITKRYQEALGEFATLLQTLHYQCIQQHSELTPAPEKTYEGLVYGIHQLLLSELTSTENRNLQKILPSILYLTYSVFGLPDLAREAALSSAAEVS